MGYLQSVASNIPGVGKAMLTCFVSNERGMAFYRRLGFSTDDFSPRDRKLRGGKVVTSDYVILSWRKGGIA
jgi:N-alpha-acetyltransferase 40